MNPDIRFRDTKNFVISEQKANSLVDQFLIQFKEHFGSEIDPMVIPELGNFTLDDVGMLNKSCVDFLIVFILIFLYFQV